MVVDCSRVLPTAVVVAMVIELVVIPVVVVVVEVAVLVVVVSVVRVKLWHSTSPLRWSDVIAGACRVRPSKARGCRAG